MILMGVVVEVDQDPLRLDLADDLLEQGHGGQVVLEVSVRQPERADLRLEDLSRALELENPPATGDARTVTWGAFVLAPLSLGGEHEVDVELVAPTVERPVRADLDVVRVGRDREQLGSSHRTGSGS